MQPPNEPVVFNGVVPEATEAGTSGVQKSGGASDISLSKP